MDVITVIIVTDGCGLVNGVCTRKWPMRVTAPAKSVYNEGKDILRAGAL